ncbi:MAG: hypothetical protein MUF77_11605 [Leptospira sp.]|nr:hypothetical protein [Leptospira sp.]
MNPAESSLMLMKDWVVLHNHPGGTSFSINDIKAIVRHDAAELTVVSPDDIYVVTRPVKGWNIDFEKDKYTADILEEAISTAQDWLRKSEARGEMHTTTRILEENHQIWSIFFNHFGINYKRT